MVTKTFNKYLSKQIYDDLVSTDDFFRQLNKLVDWYELTFDLHTLAQNERGGRPRFHHTTLFKMLFISFLYNASDRVTEEICSQNIRCKYFLELDISTFAPDHSTLSVFRTEIIEKMGASWLSQVFDEIVKTALNSGISFSTIYAVDSTHTTANVDTHKDKERQTEKNQTPRDENASWGVKGLESRLNKDKERTQVLKMFYGYKAHLAVDTDKGFITACSVSPGNIADINAGEDLIMKKLLTNKNIEVNLITADKAYGSGILIGLLEQKKKVKTAFSLSSQFLKGVNKEHWNKYLNDEERMQGRRKRATVERVNADLKNNHGLRKARYLGTSKYNFQVMMTAMVHNLKIYVKGITGVRFRMN